jgi:YD repeat-containing protein
MTANSNASYTYDSNGNTPTKTVGSDTTTYSWDYENHLTSVALPGTGRTVTFKYNPMGRRIEKSSTATTSASPTRATISSRKRIPRERWYLAERKHKT